VTGLQFLNDQYLAASRATAVSVSFDRGPKTEYKIDAEGYITFPAGTTVLRDIELTFTGVDQSVDVDSASGIARYLPVGVSEVRVLGVDELRKAVDPTTVTGSLCGFGPSVRVDGVDLPTALTGTVRDVLQRRPLTFTLCQQGSVQLGGGRHSIDVLATPDFVPVEVKLSRPGFSATAGAPIKSVAVWRPDPASLTLEVPHADEQSVLTVAQNFNVGWAAYDSTGHKLVPVRIGGWQQGWILPAGPEQMVTAQFLPDRNYRAGLLVGLAAFLGVLGLAIFARRRARRRGHVLREAGRMGPWVASVLAVAAGTFMAGWIGFAATVVAAVVAWALGGRRLVSVAVLVGAVLLGSAVAAAQPWPAGGAGVAAGLVQSSILFGCALALLARPVPETS
jgi:arabinofuranan 3-O-arabinosyltransferase